MNVPEYAAKNGIGPAELAKMLGTSRGYAHDLITGRRKPGPKMAHRLADATGLPWYGFLASEDAAA